MNAEKSLISMIEQALAEGTVELPVFDNIVMRIHKEARENKLDAAGICRILEADPVLVSEVLRMANSSFFGGLTEIRNLRDAAVRLGVKPIASIVFSVNQKRMYSASKGPFKVRMLQLWQHVSAVSLASRWIAKTAGHAALADEAFVAGLLHDVGKLSLLRIIEDLHAKEGIALTNELVDATLLQLYCSHGASLLERWNLPDSFRTIVEQQETEEPDPNNVSLMIVRLADKACAVEQISDRPDPLLDLETSPEAVALGLSEIDIAELRIMLEDCKGNLGKAA